MAPNLSSSELSDFVLGKLSPEESLRVLEEIERDPEASATVDYYASLLAFARTEGNAVLEERVEGRAVGRFAGVRRSIRKVARRRWVYAAAAVLVLGVSLGLLIQGKSILWGADAGYAGLANVDFGVGIRAESDDNVMVAMSLFQEGEYERSIRVLERLLRSDPAHPLQDHVNYSLGVVHLVAAEDGGIGSLRIFDRSHVRRGMACLRRAVGVTANPRIREESHWLMAKGHLMVGELEPAARALEEVVKGQGRRELEARRLKILVESGR